MRSTAVRRSLHTSLRKPSPRSEIQTRIVRYPACFTQRAQSPRRFLSSQHHGAYSDGAGTSTGASTTSTRERNRYTSLYDESPHWRDWFSAAEYENPWDAASPRLQPLDFAPADYATKHIIHLLQQFHRHGNRVTTEQCNTALTNLLELLPQTNRVLEEADALRTRQIAERANAILENMELVDDMNHQQSLLKSRRPRHFPKPNRDTYNTVLVIFSRTAGPRSVPQRAADIVERMEKRYSKRHELEMKPVNFHSNCVLLAWKNCQDWERPVHAIRWVLEKAAKDPALVDNSSYIHLLRICALNHSDRKSAVLGASVAVKLWQELFERDPAAQPQQLPITGGGLQSHFYSHFLQAIRSFEAGRMRDKYYAACFARAIEHGKVNRFVLQEFFLHVKDNTTFDQFLAPYRNAVAGMNADDAVQKILQLAPADWKLNAEVGLDSISHSERGDEQQNWNVRPPPL